MDSNTSHFFYNSINWSEIVQSYPPSPVYDETTGRMSRDELHALQTRRLHEVIEAAWSTSFYQQRWKSAGISPNDIQSIEDLPRLPTYDVNDLRESMEQNPPFGNHLTISLEDAKKIPFVLQTSGGTTGFPRPMLYAPREREIISILRARSFYMHGIRPGDVAQVTLSLGLSNGGLGARESLWKYNGAVPLMTGSGNTTPSKRQIEIASKWGTTALVGFPAYLRHLAIVASEELNIDPQQIGIKLLSSHLGNEERESIEKLWGCPAYDTYGFHEAGMIGSECSKQSGMHIYEDAFLVEIVDPESGISQPQGARGNIVVTSLFRHDVPVIRYNVNDVSMILPGNCECGSTMLRLGRMLGRSDNMVKLRGTNVFPEAIGKIIASDPRTAKEYICVVEQVGAAGRDELTVMVESADKDSNGDLRQSLEQQLKENLGVRILVKIVAPGELSPLTGLGETSKIRRLLDKRK